MSDEPRRSQDEPPRAGDPNEDIRLDLESGSDSPDSARPEREKRSPEAYDLHDHADDDPPASPDPRPASPRDLDVCGNCGAPMTGPDSLVCMRCGYDMKQMKVIEVETSHEEIDPDADADTDAAPPALARAGRGDQWLPAAIAAGALVLMLIAHLAGLRGLFDVDPEATVSFGVRLAGCGKVLVFAALATASGIGGLVTLAAILGTSLGDVRLAVLRIAAIASAMQIVMVLNLSPAFIDWVTQALLASGIIVGLTMLLFSMTVRDAVTFALSGLGAFLLLWLIGAGTTWVV